jgi:uncharacterized membrane protein
MPLLPLQSFPTLTTEHAYKLPLLLLAAALAAAFAAGYAAASAAASAVAMLATLPHLCSCGSHAGLQQCAASGTHCHKLTFISQQQQQQKR